jgi:hypothetical protein
LREAEKLTAAAQAATHLTGTTAQREGLANRAVNRTRAPVLSAAITTAEKLAAFRHAGNPASTAVGVVSTAAVAADIIANFNSTLR